MLDNLKIIRRRSFKKANVKTFGVFLFFSALTWLLVQLSKEYTQIVQIPLHYTNAPLDKSLSAERPQQVAVRMHDQGFFLLYYRIFRPELTIDLAQTEVNNGNLVYQIEDNRNEISEELGIDFDNSTFLDSSILIPFQPKQERRIAVVPRIKVSYAVGYSAGQGVKIEPDSVTVSGPQNIIDTIKEVPTLEITRTNVNRDISGQVKLDTTNLGRLSFYRDEVGYSLEVEKFTEGSVQIPVEVINVPENLNLAYFPKRILVYYQVNLEDYERVKPTDFRVVCDYSEVNEGEDYFLAKVVERPGFVTNVRLSERKIQFVIKK
ncbi:YbbR-like domain-containing protein [Zunongwangia sp. F363]|uniref:YbbR-like domain-containing protein n=1 Tax=Autumnicola tepida TaxID=3075595 RepID=A0ABU3CDQ4_9FLAO|nr:YbbR-like domain-containing protein [Zunongwangia sp. F363]MDT0644352.1 YbbR-like domain-containing protein [Zunongwangia sp. F363]